MKIADHAWRIAFLNVEPGQEEAVRQYLSWRPSGRSGDPIHKYISALGPFDLAVFTRLGASNRRGSGLRSSFAHVHVTGLMSILAYGLEEVSPHSLDEVLEQDVVLVSSVKINHKFVEAMGIEAEDMVTRFCRVQIDLANRQDGQVAAVLGGFGWYDLVLIVGGSDIVALMDFLLSLRRTTAGQLDTALGLSPQTGLGRQGRRTLVLETSFTIACVNERLSEESYSQSLRDSVHGRVTIVCKPGMAGAVMKRIPEFFGTAARRRNPLGKGEVVLSLDTAFPRLVAGLLRFRTELGDRLLETETVVERGARASRTWPSRLSRRHPPGTSLHAQDISPLATIDGHVHDRLQQVFATFTGRAGDELATDCFADLAPFVQGLATASPVESADSDDLRVLNQMCDCYFFGLDQRFPGSYMSFISPNLLPDVRHESGIQRVLTAADEVTRSLLRSAGQKWVGFCIFGLREEFFRFEHGVINLPWSALLRPEDWWPLFHEAAHDFQTSKLESDRVLRRMFRNDIGIDFSTLADERSLKRAAPHMLFFWELVADLVDFWGGFQANILDYVKVTWGHLNSRWGSMDFDQKVHQLVRTFFIMDTQLDTAESAKSLASFSVFRTRWDRLPGEICEFSPDVDRERLVDVCVQAAPWAFQQASMWLGIHRYLRRKFAGLQAANDALAEDVLQSILDGRPVKRVTSAVSLIRGLALENARSHSVSFSAAVAAILSLWSTWKVSSPGRRLYRVEPPDWQDFLLSGRSN